jgi:hypothetical protein
MHQMLARADTQHCLRCICIGIGRMFRRAGLAVERVLVRPPALKALGGIPAALLEPLPSRQWVLPLLILNSLSARIIFLLSCWIVQVEAKN